MFAQALRAALSGGGPSARPVPPGGDRHGIATNAEMAAADIVPLPWIPDRPWTFLRHYAANHVPGRLMLLIACVVVGQAIEAFEPVALSRIVDGLAAVSVAEANVDASRTAFTWFGVLVFIWVSSTLSYRLYQIVDIYTSPSVRALVQKHLFGYLLGHSPRYFQDNFAGKLGQKIRQAGQGCIAIIEIICFDAVRMFVLLSIGIFLLVTTNSTLAVVFLLWTILYVGISVFLARRCIHLSKTLSARASTLSGRLVDAIANADLVRSFARGRHERLLLGGFVHEELAASRNFRWFLVLMRLFQMASMLSLLTILVWIALSGVVAGQNSVGEFALVFALVSQVSMTVWNLSNRMLDFFEHVGTLAEALDLVSQKHEITDRPDARPISVKQGAVRFDAITFAHPDGQPLFRHFTLDIAPGEKVALVGPSGAGKSTLVKLLRRQYDPQGGRVLIDGQDIAFASWDSVNAAIAEVPQQPSVFHRPIRDNIRYGAPEADQAAVERAARDAHCHEFIMARATGYDTIVGEQGIKLSGGERQRVAIARALLKNAPILVLDEATSALDSESEHLIQDALWRLFQGRTVIAIAHRLSTITDMDRIVVLDRGRIVEEGRHTDLVGRGGLYARLWSRQAGGFLAAAE